MSNMGSLYRQYMNAASECFYMGPVRKTPWLLVKLAGKPPYRRWGARGPLSMHDDPESRPGKWFYQREPK
jgi:hypothetical protein